MFRGIAVIRAEPQDEIDDFVRRHLTRFELRPTICQTIKVERDDVGSGKVFGKQPDAAIIACPLYGSGPPAAGEMSLAVSFGKQFEGALESVKVLRRSVHGERHSSHMPQPSSSIADSGRVLSQQRQIFVPAEWQLLRSGGRISTRLSGIVFLIWASITKLHKLGHEMGCQSVKSKDKIRRVQYPFGQSPDRALLQEDAVTICAPIDRRIMLR
jgi:hypothetical protein